LQIRSTAGAALSIAFDSTPTRPSRDEIEPVALDLIRRRGDEVLTSAQRYAPTPDDAEDAYQRALEILLTKAPTTSEDELLPWLKTVVRHECFALRKKRERDIPVEHEELDGYATADSHAADTRAERYDRLRVGAEALGRLKPQETRALLLKAEGMSYREIAAETGWTYTKVNRCLTEGRRAFVARVAGIESGEECDRMAPLLSRLADGEASADDLAALRPHLRGCPSCKATLRDYRETPTIARDLATGGVLAWLACRAWPWVRSLFETAGAQKAAAVAASTVAVAGGGAVAVQAVNEPAERPPARHQPMRAAPSAAAASVATAAPAVPKHEAPRSRRAKPKRRHRSQPTAATAQPSVQPKPTPKPVQAPPASRTPAAPAPAPQQAEPAPADPGGGEFGP
jgi:RNA polymerase sigma factor (sigma-70 family)